MESVNNLNGCEYLRTDYVEKDKTLIQVSPS
jgi:hypothetical protein